MPIRSRVWAIQHLQDFSKPFVKSQKDKGEEGVLPVLHRGTVIQEVHDFKEGLVARTDDLQAYSLIARQISFFLFS